MDYQSNNYDGMDSRYTGNRNLYCDLCFRRCRGVYHVIERGDTLYSLGKRYHVSVADLMRANPYVNVYNLRIGEELCIPVRPQPRMENNNEAEMNWRMEQSQQNEMMQDRGMQGRRMQDGMMSDNMVSDNMMQNGTMRMNDEMMQNRERMQASEQTYVSEEELKAESHTDMENQFSEHSTVKEVLEKTGLSMSDFVEFLAKKMD